MHIVAKKKKYTPIYTHHDKSFHTLKLAPFFKYQYSQENQQTRFSLSVSFLLHKRFVLLHKLYEFDKTPQIIIKKV